jgi:hypothetical protein
MQEIINEMHQLTINIASIGETKGKVLDQKLLENVYIFIAATQRKQGEDRRLFTDPQW